MHPGSSSDWSAARRQDTSIHCLPISHAGKLSLRSPRDMTRVMSSRRPCGNECLGQRAASPFQGTSKIASSHWEERSGAVSLLPHRPQEDATLSAVTSGKQDHTYHLFCLTLSVLMEMNWNQTRSLHLTRCSCALECGLPSQPTHEENQC